MSASRKRFRVEQATIDDLPMPEPIVVEGGEIGPMHREIMAELRSIRAQMAANATAQRAAAGEITETAVAREIAETQALLETYRAQIEQCEKLKVELDLIHDAISRTKREIAVLHGKSFDGQEMAKVNGELGAVVGASSRSSKPATSRTSPVSASAR